MSNIKVFGLGSSRPQAQAIAAALGVVPGQVEEREFDDGEHKARPLESVYGADVYVVHSLYSDQEHSVNDKLCRLLFFLATVHDQGAAQVSAIVPYLCYARKDRRTKPHDPITTRYVAQMFEASGVNRVLVLDVHNPAAFENAFRCRTELLHAQELFAEYLLAGMHDQDITVLSPDAGGLKRADAFREVLQKAHDRPVGLGLMEKRRSSGVVSGGTLFADVAGRNVVIVDDLIGTGTTLLRAARASRDAGARAVLAVASHGLFVGSAATALADPVLDRIIVTDSVSPFRLQGSPTAARIEILASAPLFAQAIRRLRGEEGAAASDQPLPAGGD